MRSGRQNALNALSQAALFLINAHFSRERRQKIRIRSCELNCDCGIGQRSAHHRSVRRILPKCEPQVIQAFTAVLLSLRRPWYVKAEWGAVCHPRRSASTPSTPSAPTACNAALECAETVAISARARHFGNMSTGHFRLTAIRRVCLREDLKPVKAYWADPRHLEPDWLIITRTTDRRNFEAFDLHFLQALASACESCKPAIVHTASISFETLQIAKAQAHAHVGVEYVEWEPCDVEITNEDGSIEWSRALPTSSLAA